MMTDIEILTKVCNELDNISVPAKYTEQIAIPISNCSNLLKALNKAVIEMAKKKEEEKETPVQELDPVMDSEVDSSELEN